MRARFEVTVAFREWTRETAATTGVAAALLPRVCTYSAGHNFCISHVKARNPEKGFTTPSGQSGKGLGGGPKPA